MIIKTFPGADHKSFVLETPVKPCPCSSGKEGFKMYGSRHMRVIVSTYGVTKLIESLTTN